MLKFYLFGMLFSAIWIAYEMYTAPTGEETEDGLKITKPGKKLSDLWRKQS